VKNLRPVHDFDRRTVAGSTRAVLLALAAGELDRPLPEDGVDWHGVFEEVCRNGLLGLTHRYLIDGVSAALPPAEFRQSIARGFKISQLHMTAMYRWIAGVVAGLSDAGIAFMVLKGPALARLAYPEPCLRSFGDVDLMVRERDMLAAHAALLQLGLTSERDLRCVPPKLTSWCTTYELRYRDAAHNFVLEVHCDDLLNAGLASRELDGYWERARCIHLPGAVAKTLALEDQLVHACAHMHYHGYVKLHWFSDIAFLVRGHRDQLDWDQFLRVVRAEEAEVPVYFSLTFLDRLLGVATPRDVLRSSAPDRLRRWVHGYYLPQDRVLSLEPMPRPDFSFYHLPLLKRLLPDLLVMGRRREKLHYLLRLLAPSPAWLRHYYRVSAQRSIAGYYLLHPLKLGWHAVAEIAAIPRRNRPWWNSTP
jgi:hypothetical protein